MIAWWPAFASASTYFTCGEEPFSGCYPTLRDAVEQTDPGDTVIVTSGTYRDAVTIAHDLDIELQRVLLNDLGTGEPVFEVRGDVSFTLLSRSSVVVGRDARVFAVSEAAEVTVNGVEGLVVYSEYVADRGAIAEVRDATLVIEGGRFVGGTAYRGGQIYAEDSVVALYSLELSGGTAASSGGAVYATAAARSREEVDFSAMDVYAHHATSYGAGGGAVSLVRQNAVWTDGSFEDNAGAISSALWLEDVDLDLHNTQFVRNVTGRVPTGMGAAAGAVWGWSNDPATPLTVRGVTFVENEGAITASGYDLRVSRSLFVQNRVNPTLLVMTGPTDEGSLVSSGNWYCGNDAQQASLLWLPVDATLENDRFVSNDVDVPLVRGFSSYRLSVSHTDFLANRVGVDGDDVTPLVEHAGFAGFTFSDNLVARNRIPADQWLVVADAGAASTNLFWENGDAQWGEFVDPPTGFVGDPRLDGFTGSCDFDPLRDGRIDDPLTGGSWYGLPAEGPLWYGAQRDAGSVGVDLDGSPPDIGAYGGPHAPDGWWGDFDRDDVPYIYDCDDFDPDVRPGVFDRPYDGKDVDCDLRSDNDYDRDGFERTPPSAEGPVPGTDCDDQDPSIHPDAVDVPTDDIDQNCDGDLDLDNDGYLWPQDCDDTNAAINPGVVEDADADVPIDRNCDGRYDVEAPILPRACQSGGPVDVGWGSLAAWLWIWGRRRRAA